jgi:Putative lipoprotein LpqV
MRSDPKSAVLAVAAVTTVTALAGTACSPAEQPEPATSATATAPATPPARAGAAGVSPGGITTDVDAPSAATESEYGQACLAARRWMDGQGGDPRTLVEPYLKILQAPDFRDPGNFNAPWVTLTPGQQAGVIMAANAAADGECG